MMIINDNILMINDTDKKKIGGPFRPMRLYETVIASFL